MRELEYPFDSEYILKKSKSIKKQLLAEDAGNAESAMKTQRLHKKIAVLGGSTTYDIIRILELFLLDDGIEPEFYESEYDQCYQDAVFGNEKLDGFAPDLIYIHTSMRNIKSFPTLDMSTEQVEKSAAGEYDRYLDMWEHLAAKFSAPIIQNNFEYPFYRIMGNRDAVDIHGRISYVDRLNRKFYEYADTHKNFFINDINYAASCYGLDKWADPGYWHMYKYCMCMQAIPSFAFNLSHIIKAVFGKNKKALALDLDNTLWGGVVGDDGPENLEIGQETSIGQVYAEFQSYLKAEKDIGVVLTVDSKNDPENALAGLNHPAGTLRPDDFVEIKANWEPKSVNLSQLASDMSLTPDSFVFVDDNPAEREIIRQQVPGAAVPEIGQPEQYIRTLDRNGYFEVTSLSADDRRRSEMYKENAQRAQVRAAFTDYGDYLGSLDMHAEIDHFVPMYMSRIAQLTNKSNQFNLTTKRFTQAQIENMAADPTYITLYGQLQDRFGDNGVVSVVIGEIGLRSDLPEQSDNFSDVLNIRLWLMSCRVLKRGMEYAMFDSLVEKCKEKNIGTIYGYYYKTAKNAMVAEFYKDMGFICNDLNDSGDSVWEYTIPEEYEKKNKYIKLES
jgi:FkbH-like protein